MRTSARMTSNKPASLYIYLAYTIEAYAGKDMCTRAESNCHHSLRRAVFYPLNYECVAIYQTARQLMNTCVLARSQGLIVSKGISSLLFRNSHSIQILFSKKDSKCQNSYILSILVV